MRLFCGLIALAVGADAAREVGGVERREVKNIAIIGKSDDIRLIHSFLDEPYHPNIPWMSCL